MSDFLRSQNLTLIGRLGSSETTSPSPSNVDSGMVFTGPVIYANYSISL